MNLGAIALLIGGFYLVTQTKSKSSSTSTKKTDKPVEKPAGKPVELFTGFVYTCNTLQINNTKQATKEIIEIVKTVLKELDINPSNFESIDTIKFSKSLISRINPSCVKLPNVMTYQEKVLYFLLTKIGLNYVDVIFAIPDFTTEKYPDIFPHGVECETIKIDEENVKADYNKCLYVIDSSDPAYEKWQKIKDQLIFPLMDFLGLSGKITDLKAAGEYLAATGHYP